MSNTVTADGLTTDTQAELIAFFTAAFEAIYGADINLDSDSPDGQIMMIFIQSVLDLLDLVTQVYNSMDPDNALGVVLDQRVAINGIQRQAGTRTITNVSITTTQSVSLVGYDTDPDNPFTVADNAGNQFQLIEDQSTGGAGSFVYAFQAKDPGAVLTSPNTITVPVTIVLGVSAINNPTTYTTLGINEETDAELKIRRQKSVSLASQGYLAGLLAALENIDGVTSAFVYENNTGTTDGDGVPGHSIWVIVQGTAADADIANAIYTKRNAGCGLFGATSYVITQVDGSPFEVLWDGVTAENLFIKFTATSLNGDDDPSIDLIRSTLPTTLVPGVFEQVNINDLATLVQDIDDNTLVTSAGFSLTAGGVYTTTLTPSVKTKYFAIASLRIIILPIILTPKTVTLAGLATQQFTPHGGYTGYLYTVPVGGGSINASGLYTAPAGPGSATVRVTDSLGNTADSAVTIS